tara:strand:- start:856 stop:1314 length:459 start_codon:yes stop_codon:yes gene_type:complete
MKTRKKFIPTYHNNEFNYLISELTDVKRSIIDIDCVISKYGYNTFMIDHKKNGDETSLNTLINLSNFVGTSLNNKSKIQSFIVRSNVNIDTCETQDGITMIYEIKNLNEVVNKKNKTDFIKGVYKTTNDLDLQKFFQQETHEEIKEILRYEF